SVEFAPALYGALAAGRPVDAAVAEARKAMYTVSPLEWATPVLYLRADDARLFTITPRTQPQASKAAARKGDEDQAKQKESHKAKRYPEAEAAYRKAIRLDPANTW